MKTLDLFSDEMIEMKSLCCNHFICGNRTMEAECMAVNGTDVGGMDSYRGCTAEALNIAQDVTVKRCLCIWQNFTKEEMEARAQDPVKSELRNSNDEPIDGFCYGYSTEHIINDTDTTNFPQESTTVNFSTLLLVTVPLVVGLGCFVCGVVMSTPAFKTLAADLAWKIKPLKVKAPEEEEEEEDKEEDKGADEGDSSDDDAGGLARAKAKARQLGEWTLDIKVLQARNLPRSDKWFLDKYMVGMADPYAVIGMRNRRRERKEPYVPEHKTEILKSTLDPEWNAQFRLMFSGRQDEISVHVWDWDKYKYDDYIGEALIPTAPLVDAFRPGHSEFSNCNWYELYDKKGQLCTAGKKGKQLDMIAAVELSLKLDKTYDPVEALGDMKRAMKTLRQTNVEEVEAAKREEAAAAAAAKQKKALEAELALNVPPDVRAESQALHEIVTEKAPRDIFMMELPTSEANAPGAAAEPAASATAKKKRPKAK